ncbi:MAG: acylphosphatase [Alphaproteobacteria bacterium]|nr:acylphosphatase [Alphaproteobacteria bacterium]
MALNEDITSLRVHVHGFVQGVGFREFLTISAEQNRLDGWVRNRADGSVEALVSGTTKAVEVFVASATRGPAGARVSAVDLHNSEPPAQKGFHRRPSL